MDGATSAVFVLYGIRPTVLLQLRGCPPGRPRAATSPLMPLRRSSTVDLILRGGGLQPLRANLVAGPGAWCGRRSGIKEESAAISRHGGQPRSCPRQAPDQSTKSRAYVGLCLYKSRAVCPYQIICAFNTANVAASAANICSTRNDASVMSCGVPKVVNMLKKASSPCAVAKRDVNTGTA